MSFIILQITPYIAVTIFTVGILYRLGRWAGSRIVHNITLPGPSSTFPKTVTEAGVEIGSQVIFFKSLFQLDRGLWIGAWPMHLALGAVIGGHLVGIYTLGTQFAIILPGIVSEHLSEQISNLLGTTMGIAMFVFLLYLLYRRMAIDYVKQVTNTSDYLHLLLILAIVSVGNFMRLFPAYGLEYAPAKEYITFLLLMKPIPASFEVMHNSLFVLHQLLVQVLLVVFPFSKLMHVLGMFALRYIENRPYREPAPGMPGVDLSGGGPAKKAAAGGV